jgi:hypothetical protein
MPHEIKVGDVYKTKNGRTARIIATDKEGNDYPIVALVKDKNGDHETILAYTRDGQLACMHCDHSADLVLPEPYEDWKIDAHCNCQRAVTAKEPEMTRPASLNPRHLDDEALADYLEHLLDVTQQHVLALVKAKKEAERRKKAAHPDRRGGGDDED